MKLQKNKTVFISRSSTAVKPIAQWCKNHDVHLIAQSFITITPITDLFIPVSDWVFFSSPKAVYCYLEHYAVDDRKIGVYGKGTLSELEKHGHTAQFIGDDPNPTAVGNAFNLMVHANETVLFPVSSRSHLSIANCLAAEQCKVVIAYNTTLSPVELPERPAILVITSPSNFESYIQKNSVDTQQIFIVLGSTTQNAIDTKKLGLNVQQTNMPSVQGIIDTLAAII